MNFPSDSQQPQDMAFTLNSDTKTVLTEQKPAVPLYGDNRLAQEPKIRFLDILKEKIAEPITLLLLSIGILYSALGVVAGDGLTAIATVTVLVVLLVLVNAWNEYRAKRTLSALHQLAVQTAAGLRNRSLREKFAMKRLPRTLVLLAVFFAILISLLGYIRGLLGLQDNPAGAVLYGLALTFALIPKELPLIIAAAFGMGSLALSRRGVVIKRLHTAETLGNVTVIATDIAGILTENRLRVEYLYFDGAIYGSRKFGENEKSALRTGFLACNALNSPVGNSMAEAILERLQQEGIDKAAITSNWTLKDQLGFDNKRKLYTNIYQYGNSTVALSSGDPETLLAASNRVLLEGQEVPLTDELRAEASGAAARMVHAGERLMAFGYRRLSVGEPVDEAERELVFVGIVGFTDPLRREAPNAIRSCQKAGIRVLAITGEQPQTAKAIAGQVGIPNSYVLTGNELAAMTDEALTKALKFTHVFAGVAPEDKLRIIRLLSTMGETVAVIGEGIDDVPALKKAHVGIATVRGADAVGDAADIVLVDDSFAALGAAVGEGRRLNGNIRRSIQYYLASKAALALTFMVPVLLGVPLPFAPIQILVLVLLVDLVASIHFVEPQEEGAINKPPAPSIGFMNKSMLRPLFIGALSLSVAITAAYLFIYYADADITHARTVAFATWVFGQVFLALNLRSDSTPLLKQGILTNRVMLMWALLVVLALVACVSLSAAQVALQFVGLGVWDWTLAVGVSFAATFWIELKKVLTGKA